jgi:hypothetical protein
VIGQISSTYLQNHFITIDIPEDIKVKQLTEADLPEDWQAFPHPYPYDQVPIL